MALVHTVLLVDDHELWRSYVRNEVVKNGRWRIVGECADGADAVRQAEALTPDLTILDVSLPEVNGLQAARRILARDPSARILFLTEQHSEDIAEAALDTGARGYMFKTDAGKLLFAMEAIVNGGRYVSPALAERLPQVGRDAAARVTCRHEVGFYSDEQSLVDDYARVGEAALATGRVFVLLAANARRDTRVQQQLRVRGVALDDAIRERRYQCVRVDLLLSTVVVDGTLDEPGYRAAAAALLSESCGSSSRERPRVTVCGDGAGELWVKGQMHAAVRVEEVWDELTRTLDVHTLCGYVADVTSMGEEDYAIFQRIRASHSDLYVR